jgi:hypothetical protein
MEPPSRGCVHPPLQNLDRDFNLVIVVFAVSTMLPNPLQTLAQLHARPLQFPSWVDTTHLKYSLVIHPENSPLTNEECVDSLVYLRLLTHDVKSDRALQCRQKTVWITQSPTFARAPLSTTTTCPRPDAVSAAATNPSISTPHP